MSEARRDLRVNGTKRAGLGHRASRPPLHHADVRKLLVQVCTILLSIVLSFFVFNQSGRATESLLNKPAPEFVGLKWINSKPLTISGLKGKPILLRFWAVDCPKCKMSIATLNHLYREFSPKGLVVLAIQYRSYVEDSESLDRVINQLNIKFPVALDKDWKTVIEYWKKDFDPNSPTVLIDRNGIVRWVTLDGFLGLPPPYGEYESSRATYENLERTIETVLAEKETPPASTPARNLPRG